MRTRQEHDDRRRHEDVDIGQAIVFGALGGVLVFVITGNPAWIGIGACVGILVAALWNIMS